MSHQGQRTILFLAANPAETARLRLDQEFKQIDEGLKRAVHREQFRLVSKWAVTPNDLRRGLLDEEPEFVHFSGHGGGERGLVLQKWSGGVSLVSSSALADLFGLCARHVRCVVLNGCYSLMQADSIARQISYVIGMKSAIRDSAAIQFAIGFYDALGAGKDIETAYKFGRIAIELEGIDGHELPILKKGTGIDSTSFVLESSPLPPTPASLAELMSILELRAVRFRAQIEKAKKELEKAMQGSPQLRGLTRIDPEEAIAHLDRMAETFEVLHKTNIEAIRKGEYITSHEITGQIHSLLHNQARLLVVATELPFTTYEMDPVVSRIASLEREIFRASDIISSEAIPEELLSSLYY
jgi:hypothetical protein